LAVSLPSHAPTSPAMSSGENSAPPPASAEPMADAIADPMGAPMLTS